MKTSSLVLVHGTTDDCGDTPINVCVPHVALHSSFGVIGSPQISSHESGSISCRVTRPSLLRSIRRAYKGEIERWP